MAKLILRILNYFVTIVNGTDLASAFSVMELFVYSWIIDFYELILYPATLLKYFISSIVVSSLLVTQYIESCHL